MSNVSNTISDSNSEANQSEQNQVGTNNTSTDTQQQSQNQTTTHNGNLINISENRRTQKSPSEVYEDPYGVVRITTHVNGTFDVMYRPPHWTGQDETWGQMIVMILAGVVTSLRTRNAQIDGVCHYKDPSDNLRAEVFLSNLAAAFPEFTPLTAISQWDSAFSAITDGVCGASLITINDGMQLMSQARFRQLEESFQSILVSGSVIHNGAENASGLVTVAAKFGEKIFKVRLTGKIPQRIAEVLRMPYDIVMEDRVKQESRPPRREQVKDTVQNEYRQVQNKKQSRQLGPILKATENNQKSQTTLEELDQLLEEAAQVQQKIGGLIDRAKTNREKIEKVKAERKPRFQNGKFDTSGDKFTNFNSNAGNVSVKKNNRFNDGVRSLGSFLREAQDNSKLMADLKNEQASRDKAQQSVDNENNLANNNLNGGIPAEEMMAIGNIAMAAAVTDHLQSENKNLPLGEDLVQKKKPRQTYKTGEADVKSDFADKLRGALSRT